MNIVRNSIIKGININNLIKLLNKAYADEWQAYHQYIAEAQMIKGMQSKVIIEELKEHADEEREHAFLLAKRIKELGGTPLLDPSDWVKYANSDFIVPKETNCMQILTEAIEGEQVAIEVYDDIRKAVEGKDYRTYDLVCEILDDEIEHEHDLQSIQVDLMEFWERLSEKEEKEYPKK